MHTSYESINSGSAKILIKISAKLEKFLEFVGKIGAWLALPLIAIIIFDIISRRFFVLGSTKLQEMEWHLHAALFLLALGYAYLKNSHVRIEVIRESFGTKLKSILEILGVLIFVLPYTSLIIYFGLDFVSRSYQMNEVSAALTGLSHRWIIKSFIPLGMGFLWLSGISVLLRNIVYLISLNQKDAELEKLTKDISPELRSPAEELEIIKQAQKKEIA
tara:strand:+ start:54448 stop:55101 length:654 start_codon:yes stop_codon:yes gene_type:complete